MKNLFFRLLRVLIIILIAFAACVGFFKLHYDAEKLPENIHALVLEKAEEDLGKDCMLVTSRYDKRNNMYYVGYINADNTHAIMYTVQSNVSGDAWRVNSIASRKGSNAFELFESNYSRVG